MSIVSSRVALKHLCTIERSSSSTVDDWGQPESPTWSTLSTNVPCYAWVNSGREPVDADRTAVVIDRRMIVPLGTDVTETDRIASVTSRGSEILDGPMGIEAVLPNDDHIELVLQRIR